MSKFTDWLDHRTGYRKIIAALLIEHIPGGAKWRYVWGSTLLFVFVIQVVTGILLMTAYSPGDTTAWSSVYYIQYEMDFGWLIRGLHHFGSGTMVVLLGCHMLQVVIAGAHLPPREINWWLGLVLLAMVLAMSLTGYLLPWDQKGYEATKVATNIMGTLPVAGQWLQKIVVGGPTYGHHTLTRFYTLHVAILPPLIVFFIIAHMTVFRRHGVTVPLATVPTDEQGEPIQTTRDGWFWPDQAFRDMLVSMIIFAILLGLVIWGFGHKIEPQAAEMNSTNTEAERSTWDRVKKAGLDGRGANLDAPADIAVKEYPARPEWYFLFLFQLLKYFPGNQEIIGTVVIPGAVGALLFVLPLLGFGKLRRFGRFFGMVVVMGLLAAIGVLTVQALIDDSEPKMVEDKEKAAQVGNRAIQLAYHNRIPPEGPRLLLARDPLTQGRKLFESRCATCHSYKGEFEEGEFKASDLAGWGTKEWIRGLLSNPNDPRFLGRTKLKAMNAWVNRTRKNKNADDLKKFDADLDAIAEWLGGVPEGIPDEKSSDPKIASLAKGYAAFEDRCINCHSYEGGGGTDTSVSAPDFTRYGSPEWVEMMITSPDHPMRYGKNNTMPAYRSDLEGPRGLIAKHAYAKSVGQDLADIEKRLTPLSEIERTLIIRWMFKDYRIVLGGEPVTAAPGR